MLSNFYLIQGIQMDTGISCKENFQMCLYLSFHNYKIIFKSQSLLLFKLNFLMVPIRKKTAISDQESRLKIFHARLFLARCPCAIQMYI